MPAVTVSINGLSAAQIEQIVALPQTIETLLGGSRADLDRVLSGDGADNPLSGALGSLSGLAEVAGSVPDLPDVVAPIQELMAGLPTTALADVSQVSGAIEATFDLLGPLKDVIRSGDLDRLLLERMDDALDRVGGMQVGGDAGRISADLAEFFRLFRALVGWGGKTPPAGEVADLIARTLIGIGPDLLAAPAAALDRALGPLDDLLPAGPDLDTWRAAAAGQTAFWNGIEARFTAGGSVDWPGLAGDLQGAHAQLLELVATRDRVLAGVLAAVGRLQLPELPAVAVAVDAVVVPEALRMGPIFDGMRQTLRGAIEDLEAWHPTDVEVDALAREAFDYLFGIINESSLGQARLALITFQERLLAAIDSLPFRDLARQAEDALRSVAAELEVLDPDTLRRPLREFFDGISEPLDEISANDVKEAVENLWDGVETAINTVSDQVTELATTLQGAVGGIEEFVGTVEPSLATITAEVETIRGTLEGFSLDEPAALVIDQLNRLRDVVASIDVSILPAPAVEGLRQGGEALASVNLTAEVSGPIDAALGAVDPTAALESAAAAIGGTVGQLRALDPASLAVELDRPIDELLATLNRFGPGLLRDAIDEAVEPVRDAVRELDATQLLAPLTQLYAELAGKVDSVLDPEAIFAPLEALYQPVLDAVDAVAPRRLLGLVESRSEAVGSKAGQPVTPPPSFTAGGGVLKAELGISAEADDELFGFRPGDLLIPLIDLHRRLMAAFDALADEVLEQAGALLRESIVGRLRALDPAGVVARVDGAFATIEAELAPPAVSASLADSVLAYHAAAGRIAAGARLDLSAGDRAAAVRVTATMPLLDPLVLVPSSSQGAALDTGLLNARGTVGLGDLGTSFAAVGPRLEALLPSFLTADVDPGGLRAALRELDPSPIRIEINELFDDMGRKLVGAQDPLVRGLAELALLAEEQFLPLSPAAIVDLAQALHAGVRQQVEALGPATFKDEVGLMFDAVKRQLAIFDPSVIGEELNRLRDELLARLDALVDALLPDFSPFNAMVDRLAALKPSQLLAPLTAALQPLTELLAVLDPAVLLQPILDLIARIRADIPRILADVEAAFDEVLRALSDGGISGVSVSVSAEASVG